MNKLFLSQKSNRRGIALVIVLAMLILLSGLIVAFFNMVSSERNSTAASTNASTAREIADNTVNLVVGQIREATTRYTESATWSSQPGAIRTFSGTEGVNKPIPYDKGGFQYPYTPGSDDFVYKLYSADNMRVKAADYSNPNQGDLGNEVNVVREFMNDPKALVDGYVDLNEPAISVQPSAGGSGYDYDPRYPIFDPRARTNPNGAATTGNFGIVEGFDCPLLPSSDGRETVEGRPIYYLPMPAKWLYVMKDGTIGPLSLASDRNPIVGRTAFWTDDESCKLNINTASEGTFWDTPHLSLFKESGNVSTAGVVDAAAGRLNFGASQPVKGEVQRYAGHPATTCLSPALGWLWNLGVNNKKFPTDYQDPLFYSFKEAIYKMSPFTPNGKSTSMGGSNNPDLIIKIDSASKTPDYETKVKHLYNNVDELLFTPDRFTGTGENTTSSLNDKMTPSGLEKIRSFLTANSRSSDLNVFNRPRVTIWPVAEKSNKRTIFDHLFAFASSIGGRGSSEGGGNESQAKHFYFSRQDPRDPFTDISLKQNVDMLGYLQWLTGGPGNRGNIPGFGGNFYDKFNFGDSSSNGRDQMLTLIFDYVRCVNLVDTGTNRLGTLTFVPYTPFFGAGQGGYGSAPRSFDWSGQVTPSQVPPSHPLKSPNEKDPLQGLGRVPCISEAVLFFYRTGTANLVGSPAVLPGLRAGLMFEYSTTMPGYPGLRDTIFTVVRVTRNTTIKAVIPPEQTNGDPETVDSIMFDVNDSEFGDKSPIEFEPKKDIGLCNVQNISNHEIFQGRAFMPTLGFANQLYFFPEHKGQTNPELNPNDPSRVTGITYTRKLFGRGANGLNAVKGNYVRNQADITKNSISYFPYVGPNPATNKPGAIIAKAGAAGKPARVASSFTMTGGQFQVDIWAGETPNDTKKRYIQTLVLDFGAGSGAPGQVVLPIPDAPPGNQELPLFSDTATVNNVANVRRGLPTSAGGNDDKFDLFANRFAVARSIEFVGPNKVNQASFNQAEVNKEGDLRMGALTWVPANYFAPRDYNAWVTQAPSVHALNDGHGNARYDTRMSGYSDTRGIGVFAAGSETVNPRGGGGDRGDWKLPILPTGIKGVTTSKGSPGDWDRGQGKHLDGAFGNKVDEGNVFFDYGSGENNGRRVPYFRGRGIEETGQSFFTPNRQLPSAVMFGSLPTGLRSKLPWQTLLFRPNRSDITHPSAENGPMDHLMLDLFHLPIVEPYAISEPFSTAGKVNLNFVLAPYGYVSTNKKLPRATASSGPLVGDAAYIYRDTAIRGVLRSVKMMAVPTKLNYWGHDELSGSDSSNNYRFDIDMDATISQMSKRMTDSRVGLYRSASEICNVDLYPQGQNFDKWSNFWDRDNAQTGDNMRERPYAHIYPRLTTKSNVYQVHMRCQAVKILPSAKKKGKIDYAALKDEDFQVESEYRGSAIIERYVDPNDPDLYNYNYRETSLDPYYRFRVVATKQFNPR